MKNIWRKLSVLLLTGTVLFPAPAEWYWKALEAGYEPREEGRRT